MTEPQEKTIDGYTFKISQLPGMRGTKVFTRLTKLLTGIKDALGANSEAAKVSAALGLLEKLDENDVQYFCTELLTPAVCTTPEGKVLPVMPHFDALFQGRVDLVFKVLLFALQVNYGGFLRGLAASAAAQAVVAAPSSPSTSPKSGPAGG